MSKSEKIKTVAVIGGTGLYDLEGIEKIQELEIDTPFGQPSSTITSGELCGVRLLFLARHGRNHSLLPSEINYRANIFALKQLGAQWCISVSAVGSLKEEIAPGDVVIPDQYIDRTTKRHSTFFGNGLVAHVPFADPVCPVLSSSLEKIAQEQQKLENFKVFRGGIYVCMDGPQFSTRAESNLYRSWGASLIGMTALPEAKLAREAELAYATLAMVTDYDCWRHNSADVDVAEILATMKRNVNLAKKILKLVVPELKDATPSIMASEALRQGIITPKDLIPESTKTALLPLISKYLG